MAINGRIGTPTNLQESGTEDLLLITYPDGFPEGQINFDLADTPRKVTGVQKVAQLFLKILLTKLGSNVLRQKEGTLFAEYLIQANRTGMDSELYAIMISEVNSAASQVKYILNVKGNNDLSSQLYEVKILGIDIQQEAVTMFAKITTMDGETAQVAIPFPQLDLPLTGE